MTLIADSDAVSVANAQAIGDIIKLIYIHWGAEALVILSFMWGAFKYYTRSVRHYGRMEQMFDDHPLHRHSESGIEVLRADGIMYPKNREPRGEWR